MSTGEFNLLHEKWILATDLHNITNSYSMLTIYEKAHELKVLAGELPTQDIAILRFLLSVLHTLFYRFSPDGKEDELESQTQAIARWKELWNAGLFPISTIKQYLLTYEDRFYLFHDEYPFMQIKSGETYITRDGKHIRPTTKSLTYFVGTIAEANQKNNPNLFLAEKRPNGIDFDAAARWIIHQNAYGISPAGRKSSMDNTTSIKNYGMPWLGRIGGLYIEGDSLFETLMLNLVLAYSNEEDDFVDGTPLWEETTQVTGEVMENIIKPFPKTQCDLYSMKFREMELLRNDANDKVVGLNIYSGYMFDEKDFSRVEPMTIWYKKSKRRLPVKNDPSRQIWRGLDSLLCSSEDTDTRPGVIDWLYLIVKEGIIAKKYIRLKTVGQVEKSSSAIKDVFSDGLTIHSLIIMDLEEQGWGPRINDSLVEIEKLTEEIGILAEKIYKAMFPIKESKKGSKKNRKRNEIDIYKNKAKELAYSRLDYPFRQWLENIDPEVENKDYICMLWSKEAKAIIRQLGEELVNCSGPQAMIGRKSENGWNTAVKAYVEFIKALNNI